MKLPSLLFLLQCFTLFTNVRCGYFFAKPHARQINEGFADIDSVLERYNSELRLFRHFGAELAWNISTNMSQEVLDRNEQFTIERNIWNNEWCMRLMELYGDHEIGHSPFNPWSITNLRQLYLICRGPRFTSYQLSNVLMILSEMQKYYNTKQICIDGEPCMRIEPQLNRFMESIRDEQKLKEAWISWHQTVGSEIKPLYVSLVTMLNEGARQAGHRDMGQCWREETEINNLSNIAIKLYSDVKYLYSLLHTYVRFKLGIYYNLKLTQGPIPTHLLGNMYAQNWESLIDIVWDDEEGAVEPEKNPLVKSLLPQNATVADMVKAAESFFASMGLPRVPSSFWKNSYFEDDKHDSDAKNSTGSKEKFQKNCHGSSANMFGWPEPEYRMMMCAEVKDEDLIVFQHEMGHIMYFMAYSQLPTIFQDGANSAFHESVGDAVTYDLASKTENFQNGKRKSMKSLLKVGLAKLPQVGFGLIMDLWRWKVFENEGDVKSWNSIWWSLNNEFLGISEPSGYDIHGEEKLDPAGKFHVIDNVPYIRYFLASFLQMQFYEAMCKASGHVDMHSCQIRGSKAAGKVLWRMMSRGSSMHWSQVLEEMIGSTEIKSDSLLRYFAPLKIWLEKKVSTHNLTVGW